jgi:hypothetical protein
MARSRVPTARAVGARLLRLDRGGCFLVASDTDGVQARHRRNQPSEGLMPDLQQQLKGELNRLITFRCLGGIEYSGRIESASDVRDDHLDIADPGGHQIRLLFDHIIAMELEPPPR